MTITNLKAMYRYPQGGLNLPILLMIHGWDGQLLGGDPVDAYYIDRISRYGVFAVSVSMRGRYGASGARDVSGLEIHDIYDALAYFRQRFTGVVSPSKAAIMGMSGGGGNALVAACRHPDSWYCIVDYFGMSDYGRDATYSWWQNGHPDYRIGMEAGVGGTPATVPNKYWARDATYAITNYTGGKLLVFHDMQDVTVAPVHSQRIVTAMSGAGLTNYAASYTDTPDPVRWSHGFALSSAAAINSEVIWIPQLLAQNEWMIPVSGSVKVIGYIVTKRFSIWLGDGVSHVADVVYDTTTGQYTVTPRTGSMLVTITQIADGKSVIQTISTPTLLTVV